MVEKSPILNLAKITELLIYGLMDGISIDYGSIEKADVKIELVADNAIQVTDRDGSIWNIKITEC